MMSLSYENKVNDIESGNKVTSKFKNRNLMRMDKLYSSVDHEDTSHRLKKMSSNALLKSKFERDNAKNNRAETIEIGN